MEQVAVWDWFKSNEQKAAEYEASLPMSAREAVVAACARRTAYVDQMVADEMGGLTKAFTRGADEAKAYQFALDLVRERGPSEASRIADRVVFFVQMLSREPR